MNTQAHAILFLPFIEALALGIPTSLLAWPAGPPDAFRSHSPLCGYAANRNISAERAKEVLPFVEAMAEGKTINVKAIHSRAWQVVGSEYGVYPACLNDEYRVKPGPKYRAWTPEEVPVGSLMRDKDSAGTPQRWLILGVTRAGEVASGPYLRSAELTLRAPESVESMLALREVSRDNGNTWEPCGVFINE